MKYHILLFMLIASSLFSQIKFDADFESGNLATVSTTDSTYYEVTTISDIGGRWFYFRISGVDGKLIKVKITNSDVNRPMYSYDNKEFKRFTQSEAPRENYFEKVFEQDTVYVAYYTPYTYGYLQSRIKDWKKSNYVKVDTLGVTEHNFPVQEIILTDTSVPDENKFRIWIHARTHPGETPSSWHFDGIIQELLKDDDVIDFYRKNIIFYLYPFNNPEGVYYGRSRTNYYGVDQERQWNKADNETASAVLLLKNRMKEINSENALSIALNLHSQASAYPTFWIHTASSTSNFYYRRENQFANLAISDLPYFIQSNYRESNLKAYFPEGFMWDNYGDKILALTYETPYDHYSNGEWVTNENLFEFGATTVYGIAEFLELSTKRRTTIDNKDVLQEGVWETSEYGINFYGDNFNHTSTGNGDKKISFQSGNIGTGLFDIYGWWTAHSGNASNTKFKVKTATNTVTIEKSQKKNGGMWNLLTQVTVADTSGITVTISDDADGTIVADAIRIIYHAPTLSVNKKLIVKNFELYQNYPNPFNPTTTIRFRLQKNESVKLRIFNTLGELVATLVDENLTAGIHQVTFNANSHASLSSGIYYYQLTTKSFSETKGMVLLK